MQAGKLDFFINALFKVEKSNLPACNKLLYQNLIHRNSVVNNYDFYQIDTKPSFFSKIQMNLKLFQLIYLQSF